MNTYFSAVIVECSGSKKHATPKQDPDETGSVILIESTT